MMHGLFHFSAISVLPFWVGMIFFPRAPLTRKLVDSHWIIVPAVLCYVVFAAPHAWELLEIFRSPTPESLAQVMGQPWAASMFWAYAGAFDLFVGRWIYLDALQRGIRQALVVVPLAVCVFFGPVGFLLYVFVRALHRGPASTANG